MPLEQPAPLVIDEDAIGLNAEFQRHITRSVLIFKFADQADRALVVSTAGG